MEVERPSPHHLYWPQLDVDLALDSIEAPDRYPLVSRAPRGPGRKTQPAHVSERGPGYAIRHAFRNRRKTAG
jgi:hypothetical protein